MIKPLSGTLRRFGIDVDSSLREADDIDYVRNRQAVAKVLGAGMLAMCALSVASAVTQDAFQLTYNGDDERVASAVHYTEKALNMTPGIAGAVLAGAIVLESRHMHKQAAQQIELLESGTITT